MQNRLTTNSINKLKGQKQIVCLTAYTYPIAKIIDEYCDLILVGDSLGMVLYGMDSTLSVTTDIMCEHGKAVVKATKKSCIIVDMPFASYQASVNKAFTNAARILSLTGCQGVKLEGGEEMALTINYLTQRGIPVMAHIGLQPQSINVYGSYGQRGQEKKEKQKLINDAIAVTQAGAFAVVLENIPENLAKQISKKISIPTIGIGAGKECDGQILVTEDMIGLSHKAPKFIKKYANVAEEIALAAKNYATDAAAAD